MAEVIFLGVGGALAEMPAGNHTTLLLRASGSTILLDSGPTIVRQLEDAGVGIGELSHVYLTHQHGDHSLGLPMLLLTRHLTWPGLPLIVMAAPEVLEPIRTLVALAYPDLAQQMASTIQFVSLATQPSQSMPLPGGSGVTYRLALGQHSVPTWAIRLEMESARSLVMSGDTGPAVSVQRLASEATLLVHDTYHLTPSPGDLPIHSAATQVGQLANAAGVRSLALVHRKDPSIDSAASYAALAATHFEGTILVPQPGDVAVL